MILKSRIEENIWIVNGVNMFRSTEEALVNSVNIVGVMGAGIAAKFKTMYPDNFEAYAAQCKAGTLIIGDVFTFPLGTKSNPKYIINFPSKKHWRNPSKLEYIEKGLEGLIVDMKIHKIKSVAIPKLGCGKFTGKLDWDEVRPLIINQFMKYPEFTCVMYT